MLLHRCPTEALLAILTGLKLQPFSKRADLDLIEHTTSTLLSAQNDKALRFVKSITVLPKNYMVSRQLLQISSVVKLLLIGLI